jgi:hypothetical protein
MKTQVLYLERHQYAPELNQLHFTDGTTFNVPGVVALDEAVATWEKWAKLPGNDDLIDIEHNEQ